MSFSCKALLRPAIANRLIAQVWRHHSAAAKEGIKNGRSVTRGWLNEAKGASLAPEYFDSSRQPCSASFGFIPVLRVSSGLGTLSQALMR